MVSNDKVFQMLDKLSQFVRREKDGGCLETSMAGLVENDVCQLQNDIFDLKGRKYLMKAVQVYLIGAKVKCKSYRWTAGGIM